MAHLKLKRAVRLALATSAATSAMYGATAAAQDQEQTGDETISTVVVTGSRISSPNLESISPVTAITSEDMGLTGKVRVEDIINQLPQAFAAQGSNISNGADGTASVDLRGLGVNRTLVLVNGRRLMPGDPDGGSAADLNQIPLSLVKRVDVLTGGASSVYGADAVAGVVNFVMDNEFEGLRFDANYSFYDHSNDNNSAAAQAVRARGFQLPESSVSNGYTKDFTLALGVGAPGDRGHATFYAGYREVDAVLQSEYDYSSCALNSGDVFTCGGSGTTTPVHFFTAFPATPTCPAAGCILTTGNVLRPYVGATDAYNFGPTNYYQRPDERYTAGAFLDFDVSEKVKAYGELMFMDDRSVSQIAPSGAFFPAVEVNCDNPLWSQSLFDELCGAGGLTAAEFTTIYPGRRNVEGGGRQDDIGHESYRAIAGFKGEITSAWQYDAYFQHGRTKRNSTYLNDFSITRLERALQVRTDDRVDADGNPLPTFGTPQCISAIDGTDPACVPWNIWQLGAVDDAGLAYLQTPGLIRAEAEQQIAHADFTGDLTDFIKLPSAETGLAINVGFEYRDESTEFSPDTQFQTGDLAGQGGATLPTAGSFNVKEAFLEARLPLVEGRTGIQALSVEGGYRYSEYNLGFETDTYKAGLDWAPIEALRLRGSYQRAVRAPNIGELFSPQTVLLDGTTDPCDGTAGDGLDNGPTATLEQCLLTGMTAAQYGTVPENPAAQYNGLLGGNVNNQPETADTLSFGFVFRPAFANLTVAVDYFEIEVDDAISSVFGGNADQYILECISTGDPVFCDTIHRDGRGSLWINADGFIDDKARNLGGLKTTGIDVQANYTVDIGEHRLGFSLVGTILDELATAPLPDNDFYDCQGLYGGTCGGPAPEWRHSFRADWRTPWAGLDLSTTWRYIGETDLEKTSTDDQLAGTVPATDAHFDATNYIDLTAAITFADQYTLRLGANNVLDEEPPLIGQANCPAGPCNGNVFAQAYDTLGRQYFMTLTIDF
jgi:iron complex outermembrane receptor protein